MLIKFSLSAQGIREGAFFILSGKIFECGHYEDKRFSLSEPEADTAIETFEPVQMNYQHGPGPLDGHLGEIRRVWREGKELFAQFAVPDYLVGIYQSLQQPLPVSLEWEPQRKRITAGAWVVNPRIRDANVRVFSEHGVSFRAVPQERNDSVDEKIRARIIQDYQDRGEELPDEYKTLFAEADDKAKQEKEAAILQDAASFSEDLLKNGKILPKEKAAAAALFAQAKRDDELNNHAVKFSLDAGSTAEGSRADLVKKVFTDRTSHTLTREVVEDRRAFGVNDTTTQTKEEADAKASEARVQTMLNSTTTGRAALEAKK
jgi:hypothetical protein